MNNIKDLATILSEQSEKERKIVENATNVQTISDELQFLYCLEVQKKGKECHLDDYTAHNIKQVAEWIQNQDHRSLVLYGPYGVGKTILMYALERYFNRHYKDWRDDTREHFTTSVTADSLCMMSIEPANADRLYIHRNCDILFVDDVGVEKEKYLCYGTVVTPLEDLLDYRYIRRKKTIFTTNLVPIELCKRYGERLADRLNEDYAFINFGNHPSYR